MGLPAAIGNVVGSGIDAAATIYSADRNFDAAVDTNLANREISEADRQMQYQLGTETNENQLRISRENNQASLESEREARAYNSVGQQKQRALAAGVNPNLILGSDASASGVHMETPQLQTPQLPQSIPMSAPQFMLGNLGMSQMVNDIVQNELVKKQGDKVTNDIAIDRQRLVNETIRTIEELKRSKLDRDSKKWMIKQQEKQFEILTKTADDQIARAGLDNEKIRSQIEEQRQNVNYLRIKTDAENYQNELAKQLGPIKVQQAKAANAEIWSRVAINKQQKTNMANEDTRAGERHSWDYSEKRQQNIDALADATVLEKEYAALSMLAEYNINYDPKNGWSIGGQKKSLKEVQSFIDNSPVNVALRWFGLSSLKGLIIGKP